jgi:hypothetical protein
VVLSNDGLDIDGALERKLRLCRTRLIVTESWRLLQTFERSGTPATAAAGASRIISHAAKPRVLSFQPSKKLAPARNGVVMNRREFIDVLGGASIASSLAFPDARGQELRPIERAFQQCLNSNRIF